MCDKVISEPALTDSIVQQTSASLSVNAILQTEQVGATWRAHAKLPSNKFSCCFVSSIALTSEKYKLTNKEYCGSELLRGITVARPHANCEVQASIITKGFNSLGN